MGERSTFENKMSIYYIAAMNPLIWLLKLNSPTVEFFLSPEATLRSCQAGRGAMPIVIVCRLVTARLASPPTVGTLTDQN